MHILSILLFAISSSSDNLIVGLSYGVKNVKINFINNLVVSLVSGVGTFLSMLLAGLIFKVLPKINGNVIGSIILIIFGLYLLGNSLRNDSEDNKGLEKAEEDVWEFKRYEDTLKRPEIIDKNNSNTIEFKEAIILGIILCLNNIGLGIGASATGLNIYLTSISSLFFSLIFIPLGYYIGERVFFSKLSRYSEVVSACIIIVLGLYELFI